MANWLKQWDMRMRIYIYYIILYILYILYIQMLDHPVPALRIRLDSGHHRSKCKSGDRMHRLKRSAYWLPTTYSNVLEGYCAWKYQVRMGTGNWLLMKKPCENPQKCFVNRWLQGIQGRFSWNLIHVYNYSSKARRSRRRSCKVSSKVVYHIAI